MGTALETPVSLRRRAMLVLKMHHSLLYDFPTRKPHVGSIAGNEQGDDESCARNAQSVLEK